MPRAYTKSGSTEKYESSQWSIYWKGNTGTCTGPDASTGEYTITAPSGMSITSTKNDTSYCLTIYGGVQNWFYFENNIEYSYDITLIKSITVYVYYDPPTETTPAYFNIKGEGTATIKLSSNDPNAGYSFQIEGDGDMKVTGLYISNSVPSSGNLNKGDENQYVKYLDFDILTYGINEINQIQAISISVSITIDDGTNPIHTEDIEIANLVDNRS